MLQRAIRAHGNFTEYVPRHAHGAVLARAFRRSRYELHALAAAFRGARDAWHLHGLYEIQHAAARQPLYTAFSIGRSCRRLAHANPSGVRLALNYSGKSSRLAPLKERLSTISCQTLNDGELKKATPEGCTQHNPRHKVRRFVHPQHGDKAPFMVANNATGIAAVRPLA